MRVLQKTKVRWHRTKTLGGTGLVTRFYMAGTETLCGGSPAQRCVVSGYPSSGKRRDCTEVDHNLVLGPYKKIDATESRPLRTIRGVW